MKTKNLFSTAVLVIALALNAHSQIQPPNAGFENWVPIGSYENPVGWSSFNNFYSYGVPEMSFKTTDFNSGNYALRLISDTATVPLPLGTGKLDTMAGFVFLGSADFNNPGIAYTDRPILMQAFIKGTIKPNGNAYLIATLRKWNTLTHVRDQVGMAIYNMTNSILNYTQISVPFNYSLPDIPDTLEIKIMAGDVGPGGIIMPGNEFFIDDISFNFPVGINETNLDAQNVNIFPNPTSDELTIVSSQKSEIEILNIHEQLIGSISENGNNTTINISSFPCGIYIVKIKTEKGVEVKKFIKN